MSHTINLERRRKNEKALRDLLLMILFSFKEEEDWNLKATFFRKKKVSTFEKSMNFLIASLVDTLNDKLIIDGK